MQCTAERLTAGTWARFRFGTYPAGDFREVESIHKRFSYGRAELVVRFTNGETATTTADATWEIAEVVS